MHFCVNESIKTWSFAIEFIVKTRKKVMEKSAVDSLYHARAILDNSALICDEIQKSTHIDTNSSHIFNQTLEICRKIMHGK